MGLLARTRAVRVLAAAGLLVAGAGLAGCSTPLFKEDDQASIRRLKYFEDSTPVTGSREANAAARAASFGLGGS